MLFKDSSSSWDNEKIHRIIILGNIHFIIDKIKHVGPFLSPWFCIARDKQVLIILSYNLLICLHIHHILSTYQQSMCSTSHEERSENCT